MMTDNEKENTLPDQGGRIPRSRRRDSTVPAIPSSSSNDGLPVPCTSGGAGESTTERKEEGMATSPAGRRRSLPRVVSIKVTRMDMGSLRAPFGGVKATVSSPPPPPAGNTSEEDEPREWFSGADTAPLGSAIEEGASLSLLSSDGSARTTASGTVKRRKRGNTNAPKVKKGRAGRRQRDPELSLSSGDEADLRAAAATVEAAITSRHETRRRPPSTGEGFFAREKAQAKRELEEIKKQYAHYERLLHGEFDPREYTGKARKAKEAALESEMRELPSRDIVAQMVLAARRVEEISAKSNNLKGGYMKLLNEAALTVGAGSDALASRGKEDPTSSSSLRAEIVALMAENKALRAERGPSSEAAQEIKMRDVSQVTTVEWLAKSPRPDSPTREEDEAFPALRPAVKGKRRDLYSNAEITVETPSPPPPAPRAPKVPKAPKAPPHSSPPPPKPPPTRGGKKSLKGEERGALLSMEQLENRLQLFQTNMMREMGRFLDHIRGEKTAPPPAPSRPVRNTPPASSRPARKSEEGKEPRGSKQGGKRGTDGPPPPAVAPRETTTSWAEVLGRKARRAARPPPPPPPPPPSKPANKKPSSSRRRRIRAPATSAITITCPSGDYAEVMTEVRASVPLASYGLSAEEVSVRRGATGATVVEISGKEREGRADALAEGIRRNLLGRKGVRIDRPVKTADVRVSGLEVSVTEAEVVRAVAEKGGCTAQNIRAGEIRAAPRGLSSLWLRLPVAAAKKAATGGG